MSNTISHLKIETRENNSRRSSRHLLWHSLHAIEIFSGLGQCEFRRRVLTISLFIVAVESARVSAVAEKTFDKNIRMECVDFHSRFPSSLWRREVASCRVSRVIPFVRALTCVRVLRPVVFFHARNSVRWDFISRARICLPYPKIDLTAVVWCFVARNFYCPVDRKRRCDISLYRGIKSLSLFFTQLIVCDRRNINSRQFNIRLRKEAIARKKNVKIEKF